MVDTLYIESAVANAELSLKIKQNYKKADIVDIEAYGEVFNVKAQDFRLQKQRPSLILAEKHGSRIIPTPDEYETGGDQNYYFSHMLNCVYDCRYCFLQGMYRSANYLLFVNYKDFADDIRQHAQTCGADNPWYFSGYDCDSLAFEPVTGFAEYFLEVFAEPELSHATLELRTKSTQVRSLLKRDTLPNVVVAFSLNPDNVVAEVEAGTPSLEKRLKAIQQLQTAGWRVGLRFDPIVWHEGFEQSYQAFFKQVFSIVNTSKVDSVTLGTVRLPKDFHKTMSKLYPEHWLFKAGMELNAQKMVTYREETQKKLVTFCRESLSEFVSEEKTFIYF